MPNEFRLALPDEKWRPVTRSEVYDYVTINPKKPKQITWRYLPNPRKKRQKLPDEQLEVPQILELTESELSGSPGIKNETIITSTTSNNKDEVLVTAESTSTSNLDTILLEFVENEADNLTTSKLDAILSEFVKENGVSEKEIAEFFLVVEEAKVQNELKSTTTKSPVNLTDLLNNVNDSKREPPTSTPLVMQCCPCSGPTTTISALFTDAPNSIDISEINTIDYEDVTDQTTFLSDDHNLDDNLITTTEFEERSTEDSTETISQTDSTERIPRTLGEFDNVSAPKKPASPEHPFIQYFERLRLIYELDLKILGQLADLLSGVDEEVLPALMKSLEPILPALISQSNNVDLAQIIGYITQTLQKSTFHASLSANLGDLDFLSINHQIDPTDFITEQGLNQMLRNVIANFDQTGLRFPIQKFILGPRAFKMFGSKANNELVTYILSKKLYNYLANGHFSIEMKNGEAMLEARMPPLTIVDRCDISLKAAPAYLKGTVKRSTFLKAGGEFGGLLGGKKDPLGAAIFEGYVDFDMRLNTAVRARLGKPFFKHCLTKFNKELVMSLIAHGNAFISVKVVASNVRIERRLPSAVDQLSQRTFDHSKKSFLDLDKLKDSNDGLQPFLVFKIDFKIRTILRTLQVDHINVGKGCDIRLGRLRVFSYCGLLRKKIDRAVRQISSDINEMHAPAIIHQLQQFLKVRIGDEVAIPLLLADEKEALVESLVQKANNIASLKADLIGDLSGLVSELNNSPK